MFNNPIYNLFGGHSNFQKNFDQFAQQFYQTRQDPQTKVQELLNTGQMSQDQFNQIRDIANAITGQRR